MTRKTPSLRRHHLFPVRFAALVFVAAWIPVGFAQTGDRPADDDDVYVLDPFRVDASQDEGYVATNAISGTRLNSRIKELPMPIEVLTAEFLDDIGAQDVREGLAFSSGVVLDVDFDANLGAGGSANGRRSFDFSPSGSGGGVSENQYKLRGFTTNVQLRQGFITAGLLDSADISRVEVVRGPAALLYGHSILGGVVNVIPKYPLGDPRYEASVSIGSHDNYRATFDATGPIMELGEDTLNYRITVAAETEGDWRDWDKTETIFIAPKLELRPWHGANLYFDVQYRDQKRSGNGPLDVTSSVRNEFNEQTQVAREIGGQDESFRWTGRDHSNDSEQWLGLIEFRQNLLEWLTFVAAYQYQETDQERFLIRDLGLRANDNGTPESVRRPRIDGGDGFEAIRYRWERTPATVEWESKRFELAARFEDVQIPLLGNTAHSILIGQQDTKETNISTSSVTSDFQWQAYDDFSAFSFNANYDHQFFRETYDERWQTGQYGVYQGKFWNDTVQLVAGIRHDEYMVRVRDFDYDQTTGVKREEPKGSLPTDSAGDQRRWNTGPWAVEQGLPGARGSDAPVREGFRFGGVEQKEDSPTVGLTWNIMEELSVYGLTAAGLVPNPGQRDGVGNNFDAERTQSREIGVKFDLMKGESGRRLLSGTVSAFQIERENAIWFYSFAPSPRNNKGVQRADNREAGGFDPRLPRSFAVDARVFDHLGQPSYVPVRPPTHIDQLTDINAGPGGHPASNDGQTFYVINYETLDQNPIEREAIETTLEGFTAPDGTFIQTDFMNGPSSNRSNWTGNSRGSDTAFNDESEGIDAQLILSPLDNWQVTFNYAYIERVVTEGFTLVDFVDPLDGINYGTEYDLWIWRFGGPDNFTDPTRASTGSGDTLVGKSLDDSPKHSFSIWSNYKITDGTLRGLALRAGVIYTGERQSAVVIGDGNLNVNTFPTPDFNEHWDLRLGLGYNMAMDNSQWRFNFNVYNVLDDTEDVTYAEFVDDGGNTVVRRARSFYAPRSFRFSVSVSF